MAVTHNAPRASFNAPSEKYERGNEAQFRRELERTLVDVTAYINRVIVDPASVAVHASSHQNGGADEISVNGLNGVLVDPQPTNFALISDRTTAATGITKLGTINTGVWNGSSISTTYTDAKVVTVTGTTNRITSSGGGSPAIDISSSYVGQSSITTLGTITTGVWTGTAIGDTYISSAASWNARVLRAGDDMSGPLRILDVLSDQMQIGRAHV